MCIIACSPEGKTIPKENLEQCFRSNSDGAGYMYSENGKLIVKKGFFTFDEFYDSYLPHEQKKIVLHFRIKTHGERNEENCHPFLVDESLAFVHNGVIKIEEDHKQYSDTWHFNEKIVKPMYRDNRGFLKRIYNQELIKSFIGYSKLVFMDGKGRSMIINPDKGEWHDGVWYSNGSYKVHKPKVEYSKWFASSDIVEGEVVEFKYNYKFFRKGDVAYVEDIYAGNMAKVVVHNPIANSSNFEEITAVVPLAALSPLEVTGYAY